MALCITGLVHCLFLAQWGAIKRRGERCSMRSRHINSSLAERKWKSTREALGSANELRRQPSWNKPSDWNADWEWCLLFQTERHKVEKCQLIMAGLTNEQVDGVITKHCMSYGKNVLLTGSKTIKRQGAERVKMFKLCMHLSGEGHLQ